MAYEAETLKGVISAHASRRGDVILLFVFTRTSDVKAILAKKFASRVVPVSIIVLDHWPVTPNGICAH